MTPNGRFCVETAMNHLQGRIDFPDAILQLKSITTRSSRSIPTVFKFFEQFDFSQTFMQLENHKSVLKDVESIKSLNTLQVEVLFTSHLQGLMFLLHRTEEFSSEMRASLLNDLTFFFKEVKIDCGIFKTDPYDAIEALKSTNAQNFSTQISTEPSYFIGHLLYLKGLKKIDDMQKFVTSLNGTIIRNFSYLYGMTVIREIFER